MKRFFSVTKNVVGGIVGTTVVLGLLWQWLGAWSLAVIGLIAVLIIGAVVKGIWNSGDTVGNVLRELPSFVAGEVTGRNDLEFKKESFEHLKNRPDWQDKLRSEKEWYRNMGLGPEGPLPETSAHIAAHEKQFGYPPGHWERQEKGLKSPPPFLAMTVMEERVFQNDFENWPRVWELKGGHYRVFRVDDRFISPRSRLKGSRWARSSGFVTGGLVWFLISHGSDDAFSLVGLIAGAIVGLIVWKIMGSVLWHVPHPFMSEVSVYCWEGAIDWEHEFDTDLSYSAPRTERILAGAYRRPRTIFPHRLAPAEGRKIDRKERDAARSAQKNRNIFRRTRRRFYEGASEVVIDTGEGGTQWLKVAEYCDDDHMEKAGRLRRAIVMADEAAQGVVKQETRPRTIGQPIPPPSGEDDLLC